MTHFSIWLAPGAGKMNQVARCDWLPEQDRALASTRCTPQEKSPRKPYNKFFIDQICWFVSVHKHAKKNLANIQSS